MNNKVDRKVLEEIIDKHLRESRIDEGLWDKIKNKVFSLIGTWEKGGGIMGRGERTKKAEAQVDAILAKADSESSKALGTMYKELKAAGFPNQENKEEFLQQAGGIYDFYANVKAAVEKGELPAEVANIIIKDLRAIMQKFIDYDLYDGYKHFTEGVHKKHHKMIIETNKRIRRKLRLLREQEEAEQPQVSGTKETSVMKSMKSDLLPGMLARGGAAAILAGLAAQSDFVQNIFTEWVNDPEIVSETYPVATRVLKAAQKVAIPKGAGLIKLLGFITGLGNKAFDYGQPFSKVYDTIISKFGSVENLDSMVAFHSGKLAEALNWMHDSVPANATFGQAVKLAVQHFGNDNIGVGAGGSDMLGVKEGEVIAKEWATEFVDVSQSFIRDRLVKKATRTGVALAIGGPALVKLGIAMALTGLGIKLLRVKGLSSSRLAALNGILEKLDDLPDSGITKDDASDSAEDNSAEGGAGEEEKKSGGNGEVIHIFRKGPHKFIGRGKKDMNLVDKLMGGDVGLPNWAVKDVTNRIKQELENKGFVVKEGLNLENLLEKKKKKKKKEKPRKTPDAVPAKKSDTTRAGGATRSAKAAQDAREKVGPAMDRDVAGPGDNRGKIARMVIEFGSDTTVVKDGKTLRFSRKQLFDNPDEFIAALSPEEKALLMRLPEDPQKERSKFDFFKMTTDQRKELYLKMKQGKVDFEKEFRNQPKAQELATDKFFISDLRDILETGHTAHGEQPIDPEIIRDAMETISDYLGDYLDDAGVVMRETVELNRWSVLAGIKTVLRG
jgi:hypothetical protein